MPTTWLSTLRIRPHVAALFLLAAAARLLAGRAAFAQQAEYLDSIETEPSEGGIAEEVDAGEAQAERAEEGEPVPGVSPHTAAKVEKIVVQARKRAELLEDTPVSVTAIGEAQLREAGVTSIDEVQQLVPNLVFTTSFTGVDSEIKIRGVGTSAIDGIFDPGVGIYLDGVFLSRTAFQIFDIIDIAQIEVLRGPQGTLFGKNTVGGALNVTSVKPHDELEAFALVRPGNFGSVETRATLNVPISDKILSRFAFGSRNSGGYTTNTFQGDLEYNDPQSLSFLGTLRFLPTDDITIDLSGAWGKNHGHGPGPQCRVVVEAGLGGLIPGFYDACRQSEPFRFQADAQGLQSSETPGTWAVGTWDVGDAGWFEDLTVKAIGAWRLNDIANRIDLDGTQFPVVTFAANGGGPEQGEPYILNVEQGELQVNSNAWEDRITFVSGLFGLWESQDATSVLTVVPDILGQITQQRQQFKNWTWALYGQGTIDLLDWLSLTGGLRYTQEKKGAEATTVQLGEPDMPTISAANSALFDAWTPMASLAARFPDDLIDATGMLDHVMAYFTYSQGFKGGGFNLATGAPAERLDPFEPETLDSFEVGVKTIAFEERLTFNASFFYGNYDDIQVTTIRVLDPGSTDPANFERITLNAAKATTKGFELEAFALPVDGLEVRGSAGLTDARYDEFFGPSAIDNAVVNREGQTFNGVPKWMTHLAVQYSFPVEFQGPAWLQGWLTPRLEWYYQSEVHWDFVELPQATQSGYNLLHARLSYDFWDDHAQVAMWAKNMLDEEYFDASISLANVTGTLTRFYSPPALFGAELSYRF